MIPFIPIIAGLAATFGLGTLWWYHTLSREDKEKADEMARQYARKLYGKALNELTRGQFQNVLDYVKENYGP